jgi:hypothetical protein
MSDEADPKVFRSGMEIEDGPSFIHPEVRPGPPEWEAYRRPRFSRRVRIVITAVIWAIPALLIYLALSVVIVGGSTGDGRARAAFVFFLFPLVPAAPLLLRATKDLWGTRD